MCVNLLNECHVFMVASLLDKPKLEMDQFGEFVATFDIKYSDVGVTQYFSVVVTGDMALRLRQYSFPGLHMYVAGDLYGDHIVADEIGFVEMPTENTKSDKSIPIHMINKRTASEPIATIH